MKYHYKGFDQKHNRVKGDIDAQSPRQARQMLRERQIQADSLKLSSDTTLAKLSSSRRSLKGVELVLFTRQLATLLSASLPLDEAILVLEQQSTKPSERELIHRIRMQIIEGQSLSEALKSTSNSFGALYLSLVTAGEATGNLAAVLVRLADHLEQNQQIKTKLIQALIYPIVLTVVAISVIGILLTTVVPKVVEQFVYFKQSLPLSTQLLMQLSDGSLRFGPWLLIALLLSILLIQRLRKGAEFNLKWDRNLLRLPLVGKIILDLNLSRYIRTLNILTHSAVPILDAMVMATAVLTNSFIKQKLVLAEQQVREGESLSAALTNTGLLSPMIKHLINSGENSGELDSMLGRVALIQEQRFQHQVTIGLSMFTPILIILMSGFVFFIVIAILQPILQLNNMV